MPNKRKRFINKKDAVSYRLVPKERSALNEDDSTKYVLVPVSKEKAQISALLPPSVFPAQAPVKPEKRIFPSKGPRPDWDPDIVAALDDDFDYDQSENALDDDFIALANNLSLNSKSKNVNDKGFGETSDSDEDTNESESDIDSSQFSDAESVNDNDTKSRFTTYSLTSAVTNCSESFKTFNERFEKVFESYDDDQIGALDCEEIGGYLSTNSKVMEELISKNKNEDPLFFGNYDEVTKQKILNFAESPEEEKLITIVSKKPIEYDCESILSTYSNIYNHPTIIKAEHKVKKCEVPTKPLKHKLTKGQLKLLNKETESSEMTNLDCSFSEEDNEDICSLVSTCNVRLKDETPDQKRERKKLFKEIKREKRVIKKENKIAFSNEKRQQMNQKINANRNAGIKLL